MENSNKEKIQRQSNFEILRIFAIIMIIFHHIAVHSNFSSSNITSYLYIVFIQMGGKIGVNIFVLISGYFLINTEKIKIKKILKLWGQMFFYSLLIYAIFTISGIRKFENTGLISALFPVLNETWWFATVYFILYLISPILNIILKKINKKIYNKIIIFVLVFLSIMPNFKCEGNLINSLIWFIVLYCVSGYIKLYSDDWKINNKKCFIFSAIIVLITYSIVSIFYKTSSYLFAMESLPIFLISYVLFLGFKKTNIKNNKYINKLASTTFGIYLIHDNMYMRSFLWCNLFNLKFYESTSFLIPYAICIGFMVFTICAIIDLIRQYTVERYYMKFMDIVEKMINYLKI